MRNCRENDEVGKFLNEGGKYENLKRVGESKEGKDRGHGYVEVSKEVEALLFEMKFITDREKRLRQAAAHDKMDK